ncbi:MAG TPA: transporter [Anaeromyxobacter sp.]|nr:transporter [Anaeromyxobacter sp.]
MTLASLLSRISTIVVLAAALVASPVRGDEAGAPDGADRRVLNGHVFMPSTDVPPPFVTTSFASAMVVGAGQTSASYQVGDQVFSGTLQYAGIGGVLAYEYGFLNHFQVRVKLSEIIYSGTSGKSAIVVGTTLQGGGSAGFTASLPLGDSARVGFLFDAGYQPNLALTIGTAIKSVIDSCSQPSGCDVTTGQVFQIRHLATYEPAASISWAPLRALGLTGNVGYLWASEGGTSGNNSGQEWVLGAAADYDFGAISSVPVGLQVQFKWSAPRGSFLQHVTDLGGGIFYTGRKNLALGVQVINRQFAVTPDVNVSWNTYISEIGLRYYW